MSKFKPSKNSSVIPSAPMSDKEFKVMIKATEIGPFYSVQEVVERVENWKTKYFKS